VRYHRHVSRVCVSDPAGSVFADYWRTGDTTLTSSGSRIEGIGRPRVEASFIRELVDELLTVSDRDSIAAMRNLSARLGRKVGPSTGTSFHAMLQLAGDMKTNGMQGSLLALICDSGERYLNTYHNDAWVSQNFPLA